MRELGFGTLSSKGHSPYDAEILAINLVRKLVDKYPQYGEFAILTDSLYMRGKFHMGPTNHADAIWTSRLNSLPTHKSFVWLFTRGHMDIAGDSRAGELSNAARISLGNPFPPPLLQEWQAFAAQLK